MIDLESLWVASLVLYHSIGLTCLFFSLQALSHGSSWLLSWTKGKANLDVNKWNVVVEKEQQEAEDAMPCFRIHKLSFHDLGCSYLNSASNKSSSVLKSCHGSVSSGGMLALLGPSGSGKSTLLDMIAGRKTTGVLTGEVKFDGQPLKNSTVSYVPQHMDFPPSLSLNEALSIVACLVLPLATSIERAHRMNEVLESLGLLSAQNTLIGGWLPGGFSIRGLSGGERKRLSISTGLLNNPRILVLDEPTTGERIVQ